MISVVFSTYNRGNYLRRSLEGYARQRLNVPFELIVIDDDSTDDTYERVLDWKDDLDIKYVRLWKRAGDPAWRDCSRTVNMGIRAAKGSLVIPTHPEVIPGVDSLQALWDNRQERTYLACKVYYLTPTDQDVLDTVDWQESNLAVRQIPNFYSQHSPEINANTDYMPQSMDTHKDWGSWVFGGYTKETWRWFGGFSEFDQWGSVDVDQLNRRIVLGIPIYTPQDPETICIHQNHDVKTQATHVLTPRNMEKAMDVPYYHTPEQALLGNI